MLFKNMKSIKAELIKFLNSVDFGLEIARDYYGGDNEFYRKDQTEWKKARNEAVNTLQELGKITDSEIIEACKNAYSGRLEYNGNSFKYIAGQFYDNEIPFAVLKVAEYIKANRK
jgi:hypothetical protein